MIRCLAWLVALTVLGAPSGSYAQADRPLVVLVSMQKCCSSEAWPEAELATMDEFGSLGMKIGRITGVATGERERREELRRFAIEQGALCAIRIVRPDSRPGSDVEIRMTERLSRKTVYRLLHADGRPDEEEARIVALQIVEALRTSLLEFSLHKADQRLPVRPEENRHAGQVRATKKDDSLGNLSARLGAGVVVASGGIGATGVLSLGFGYQPFDRVAFELEGSYSAIGQRIDSSGANASFDLATARAWVLYTLVADSALRPRLGVGAGVLVPWSSGSSGNFVSELDRTVVGYVGLTGRMAVLSGRMLRLQLGIQAGLALPAVEVNFESDLAASFGMPLIEGFLSVEFGL